MSAPKSPGKLALAVKGADGRHLHNTLVMLDYLLSIISPDNEWRKRVVALIALDDAWLEKLYVYTSWLSRLLPSRDVSADITITDDMLSLAAFKLVKGAEGRASLLPGETTTIQPITEFGANAYTEEEEKSLSEIIETFNERHGTNFSREDFMRFERVTREVMDDEMVEMIRKNPADVVYNTFSQAFFREMVKMFQQDNEMRNIVMTDKDAREQATRHFFKRAQRQAREA